MGDEGDERGRLIHRLGERVKELTALHHAARVLLGPRDVSEAVLHDVVALLPAAMQFPELATAALRGGGWSVATHGHAATPTMISAGFRTTVSGAGTVEVAYREPRPFLAEERELLASIAEMLGAALDRDQIRRELEAASERFNLALDTAGMGVWEWDVTTNTSRWSRQLAAMTGVDHTSAVFGQNAPAVIHPDDLARVMTRLANAAEGADDLAGVELRMRNPDGGWRHMIASARVIREPPARATRIVVVLIDVSARRALEDSLRQAQKVEALGQVAAGVAHDFNNLLTIILANANFLREELGPDHDSLPLVGEIVAASDRGAGLTRQLLAFSRTAEFKPEAIHVATLVAALEPILARLVKGTAKIATKLDRSAGAIWADATQMEQVILNLVVNARDASLHGGTITIGVERVDDGAATALYVRDTGTGIPDDARARLFEPFFTTKGDGKGTGLGLAVVADVTRRWGGQLAVDSEVGKGTTFRLVFPVAAHGSEPGADTPRVR